MGAVTHNRLREAAERGVSHQRAHWGAVHRVRLGHVRKLLHGRYGVELPDDDAGAEDLRILLHVKAQCYSPQRRETAWQPDGRGFAKLTVIDAKGHVDRVTIRLH